MNLRLGGQSLFAATRQTNPRLQMRDDPRSVAPDRVGAPDIATAIADIDAWFQDAGGGFETVGYLGGAPGGALYLGEGHLTQPGIGATEPGIRTALSGLAMAALAAEGSLPAADGAQARWPRRRRSG
jgi:flagellar hook-associated protein 3 FlgL